MTTFIRKNLVIGGLVTYLLVWLLLVSIDNVITSVRIGFYESQDYTYWAEYIAIEPVKPTFTFKEPIEFSSTVIHQRPSALSWNDILFCDKNGDGDFIYFTNAKSSRGEKPVEPNKVVTSIWEYGNATTKHPPVGAECYLESEITYTPPELQITEDKDRLQRLRSKNTFKIIEP